MQSDPAYLPSAAHRFFTFHSSSMMVQYYETEPMTEMIDDVAGPAGSGGGSGGSGGEGASGGGSRGGSGGGRKGAIIIDRVEDIADRPDKVCGRLTGQVAAAD